MTVAPTAPAHDTAPAAAASEAPPGRPRPIAAVAVAAAVLAGVALRLYSRSDLWLDEALTVNIADLPVGDIVDALRRDGAPPLYYFLLHGWMSVFGTGNEAARLLSAVFSVAALPLAFVAGRRLGGRPVAVASLLLVASSPFAIRYATEARMYSLASLLAIALWLLVRQAVDDEGGATGARLAGIAVLSGLLLLTHYWAFFLLAVGGLLLARAAASGRAPWSVVVAVGAGGLLFVPWLPHFLYQVAHTGTPWGTPPGPPEVLATTLVDYGGGAHPEAKVVSVAIALLLLLALLGRAIDHRRIELDLRTRPGSRAEAVLAVATLLVATFAGLATAAAFASRYTAIVFPFVMLVAAFGARAFADRRVLAGVLAAASLAGLAGGVRNTVTHRTQATEVAAFIAAHAQPGDVVSYCPDQIAPDVERLLPESLGLVHMVFADDLGPERVDWVDYEQRMRTADPAVYASRVLERAEGRTVWHVWMSGYRTLERTCQDTAVAMQAVRPNHAQVIEADPDLFERQVLLRLDP